jgi:hypothetical protein
MPNWGKKFYSNKFKDSVLHYEKGFSIQLGEICWTYRPKPAGLYNDLQILRMGLVLELDANEKVIAAGVYRADAPNRVKAPHAIFPFSAKRRRRGSIVDMNTSTDGSMNGSFFPNYGATAFMILRMCFMPLLVWNNFALKTVKDWVM